MDIFEKLKAALGEPSAVFTTKELAEKDEAEHAVIVEFAYGQESLKPLLALERKLEKALAKAGCGEYDGNEVATDLSDGILYLYGPSADKLYEVVGSILEAEAFMKGATVKKRYGPPEDGVEETSFTIPL